MSIYLLPIDPGDDLACFWLVTLHLFDHLVKGAEHDRLVVIRRPEVDCILLYMGKESSFKLLQADVDKVITFAFLFFFKYLKPFLREGKGDTAFTVRIGKESEICSIAFL